MWNKGFKVNLKLKTFTLWKDEMIKVCSQGLFQNYFNELNFGS